MSIPKISAWSWNIYLWSNLIAEWNCWWWRPWANTIWYYTMDNDILNHATTGSTFPDGVLNTATFSTTESHWKNTYSLYCDWTTKAYLPATSNFEFWTNDFTVSVWVYSETNSWQHTWFISNYYSTSDHKQWWRLSSRFNNVNRLNFCWNAWNIWSSDIWVDVYTNTSIKDWWHNVILTRISWIFRLYLDSVLMTTYSSYTDRKIWRNTNIRLWFNSDQNQLYSKVYMNDLIFEDIGWSDRNVEDYYKQTK